MDAEPDDGLPAVPDAMAVVVRSAAGRYAVPLREVAEVVRLPALTRLPGVAPWVAGLANWRGRVLPVLDLGGLLGVAAAQVPAGSRVVVVGDGPGAFGVRVDAVDGLTGFTPEAVQPAPHPVPGPVPGLVTGQLVDAGGPVAVLDVAAVRAAGAASAAA